MTASRLHNSVRSSFFGVINKLITLLCPFIIRTIMLRTLGSEYLGLSSLYTSILNVLSLSELGFGSAIVYSMYKPMAEGDTETVCALLTLYRKLYRIIGCIVLTGGLLLTPFLNHLIRGSYPANINLMYLYFIYLFNVVISYFLFAYKSSIFTASQREDMTSKISSIMYMLMYIAQIILLLKTRNYYIYIVVLPLMTLTNNIVSSFVVGRLYPQYQCRGKMSKASVKEIYKKVIALIGHKINGTVISSADSLVISAFLGLNVLANYSNYYLIISILSGIFAAVYAAIRPSIGHSMITEPIEKNYANFKKLLLLVCWTAGWCCVCLLSLYQHFMYLWVGKTYMLRFSTVALLIFYFYEWKIMDTFILYRDAGGMWWSDRFRPYIVSILNLVINIALVNIIGLNGVIISTVATQLFISFFWVVHVLFKEYFHLSAKAFYIEISTNTMVVAFACILTYVICEQLPSTGYSSFLFKSLICCIIPNIIFFVAFRRKKEYIAIKSMITGRLKTIRSAKINSKRSILS